MMEDSRIHDTTKTAKNTTAALIPTETSTLLNSRTKRAVQAMAILENFNMSREAVQEASTKDRSVTRNRTRGPSTELSHFQNRSLTSSKLSCPKEATISRFNDRAGSRTSPCQTGA